MVLSVVLLFQSDRSFVNTVLFHVFHHTSTCSSFFTSNCLAGKLDNPTETKGKGSKHGATTWAAHGKGQQSNWKHHHHHLHSSKRQFCDEGHGPGPAFSGFNETSHPSIKLRRMTHHISCDKWVSVSHWDPNRPPTYSELALYLLIVVVESIRWFGISSFRLPRSQVLIDLWVRATAMGPLSHWVYWFRVFVLLVFVIPLVPHKAVAEVSKIGNLNL